MRKVSFVVFNNHNKIIDRFMLDTITDIKGVGMKLNLSTIDGDIESVVTKVRLQKQPMKFKIHFINRSYEKYEVLLRWIERYSTPDKLLAIEYTDGVVTRYALGKVTDLVKTEKDQFGQLVSDCTFMPLTAFFTRMPNSIKIAVSSTGKSYPLKYPYSYGASMVMNNEIKNDFIEEVPVTVTIKGSISNPTVRLFDENNEEYNTVKFPNIDLNDDEYIVINSDLRKIYYFNGEEEVDFTAETDPEFDTFLTAKRGKSTLSVNLTGADTGELTGDWRKYNL